MTTEPPMIFIPLIFLLFLCCFAKDGGFDRPCCRNRLEDQQRRCQTSLWLGSNFVTSLWDLHGTQSHKQSGEDAPINNVPSYFRNRKSFSTWHFRRDCWWNLLHKIWKILQSLLPSLTQASLGYKFGQNPWFEAYLHNFGEVCDRIRLYALLQENEWVVNARDSKKCM